MVRKFEQKADTDLADFWFYEIILRIYWGGERAFYSGLKSAGINYGPVLSIVEQYIEFVDPTELISIR